MDLCVPKIEDYEDMICVWGIVTYVIRYKRLKKKLIH